MKTIGIIALLLLSLQVANASTEPAIQALKANTLKGCEVSLTDLSSFMDGEGKYAVTVSKDNQFLRVDLSDETKFLENISSSGDGLIVYKQTKFIQSMGPFQYHGDRTYFLKLKLENSQITKLSISAQNERFPWKRVGNITCK